jgi:hypothetical protein
MSKKKILNFCLLAALSLFHINEIDGFYYTVRESKKRLYANTHFPKGYVARNRNFFQRYGRF